MASENGIVTAALTNEQLQAIRQVLTKKERPLSWKSFAQELEKCNPSFHCQSIREALCRKAVPGILSSRDFITLDTPRNVGLLKLQLVVVVNEEINGGRFSTANHYFHMIASDGEKDELGHNEDTLAKSILEFDDVFIMSSLSSGKDSYKKVVLKPEFALLHKSFFACEKKSKASAVHKLKYFLILCHGITDVRSAFEFSRCLLTKEEKYILARSTIDEFRRAVEPLSFSIHISGNAVAVSASLFPNHEKQTKASACDDLGSKPKKISDVFDEKDISLFRDILQEGPLSWKFFSSQLESRRPKTYSIAIREMFCQSQPDGLINSPDFVSLNNVKSTGLAKLHFIASINNKLGCVSLGKVSHQFNVFGSNEEREEFGRNTDGILQSLLKYKNVFLLPVEGGNQRIVKCGRMAIPFDSFFQLEGKSEESFNHKLKYFLNLCGGTCTTSSAYEFSRNLLRSDEKQLFMCNKESFVELVSSQKKSFMLTTDRIQLCASHLWSTQLKAATVLPGDPKIPNSEKKDQTKSTSVKRMKMSLTEDFVKDILKTQGYPMSWTEFKQKFLMLDESPENTVQAFMQQYSTKVAKSLCLSKDFVALNTPFHRNRLKLQLILENWTRSSNINSISLRELQKEFEEIASVQEIMETQLGCQNLQEFLWKFPKVFIVKDGTVRQGSSALNFQSFFAKEREGALLSVLHKLKYFVNICGDYCDIQFACKFLQRNLTLEKELELVDTDKKVFSLIEKIQCGHPESDIGRNNDGIAQAQRNFETPEERKSTANKKLKKIKSILEQKKHAALWRNLDGILHTFEERECWVAEFVEIYLPTLESCPLICTKEFVSLNTPEDRAFLKVCLLVNMNIKCKKDCTLETLLKQAYDIGSAAERRFFDVNNTESYLKSYPSVFVISGKSSRKKIVHSGNDMPHFEDLFRLCADHSEKFCLRCLLEFFVYISGGASHFNKAFAFMKLMVELAQGLAVMNIAKMKKSDFERLIKSCDRIHLNEESVLKLLSPFSNYSVASKDKKETSEHDHAASWPIGTWKCGEEERDKEVSAPPPSQEKLLALPAPSEASSDSSIHQNDDGRVQSASKEDALSITSSTTSTASCPRSEKKRKKEAAAAVVPMTMKPKVDVNVEVIEDDLKLDQLIKRMQNNSKPIMSIMHCTDALVVLDWFGVGFILPVPKKGFANSSRWTRLYNFFTDTKIAMVTFDCETVGRFLWERMSLKLVTVFDIKSGVQLMFSETENDMPTINSINEMCWHFGCEGPDQVNAHIVGNLEFDKEHIQLDREELLSVVQNAAVLVPSVYAWIYKELDSRLALNELHYVTMGKLKLLDTMAIDDTTMSASIDSSTSTTPLPPSNESSSSVPSFHSSERENPMVPFTGYSSSFSTSLSQSGTIPSQCLIPVLPPKDDWFSEELDDPAGIPVALESSCDQETYCLRKGEGSSISQVPQEEATSYDRNLSNLTDELIRQYSQSNTENIIQLLTLLGDDIFTTLSSKLKNQSERTVEELSEITLHVGRHASARFHQDTNSEKQVEVDASSKVTTSEDLKEIEMKDALTGFDDYNRCGVEGCLHSIRRITNRKKKLIGLTVRVALPLLGCADMMYDIALDGKSTLILGRPGVGKTTLLRELARCLSDTEGNKVVVIDTCNEIAGDCDTPHFSIGRASRLQVDSPENQHQVIAESAKNHNPDVVIIDLVELPSDVSSIARLRKQGIKVIAGVSSDSVSSLLYDENLSQMFKVWSSDFLDDMSSLDSAGALAKSKLRPVFEVMVEMKETDHWHIHDLMYTLSNVSNSQSYRVQERTRIGLNRRQPGWEQEILLREKVVNPQDTLHYS